MDVLDVIFEIPRGKSFTIEVGLLDTVLEIKEKIEKEQNILISEQTLIFNGKLLQDDGDAWKYEIYQNCRIQLNIPKVQLNIKVPKRDSQLYFNLEMQTNDTVLRLKEILVWELDLGAFPHIPISKIILQVNGIELRDDQFIRECDNNEIEVSFIEKVTVLLSNCRRKKADVEVNSSNNVGELRMKLEELKRTCQFPLLEKDYFFIHKQEVMDERRSFLWYNITQGDIIEVYHGRFTGDKRK